MNQSLWYCQQMIHVMRHARICSAVRSGQALAQCDRRGEGRAVKVGGLDVADDLLAGAVQADQVRRKVLSVPHLTPAMHPWTLLLCLLHQEVTGVSSLPDPTNAALPGTFKQGRVQQLTLCNCGKPHGCMLRIFAFLYKNPSHCSRARSYTTVPCPECWRRAGRPSRTSSTMPTATSRQSKSVTVPATHCCTSAGCHTVALQLARVVRKMRL